MDALDFRAVYDFFELVYRSPGGLQGTKFEDGGRVFGDCLKLARVIASPPTPVKPDAPAGHAVPSNPSPTPSPVVGTVGGAGLSRLL